MDASCDEVYKPTTREKTSKLPGKKFPYFAASTANLVIFVCGITFAWPSPVIPKLNDPEENPLERPITLIEQSWIVGLLSAGGMIGPFVAGRLANRIGRKRALLVIAIPMVVSFLASAFAKTVPLLCFSRCLIGFSVGSAYTVVPMFLGEISNPRNRGKISGLMGVFNSSGIMYAFAVGPFLSVRNFCLACLVPLVIFFPLFLFLIPETPQFLAAVDKKTSLKTSLLKLRSRTSSEAEEEVAEMLKRVQENQNQPSFLDLLRSKPLRKALIITLTIILLQMFSGMPAIIAYMQIIFDATGTKISPEISPILVALVQICSTVISQTLVDRLGRRILLMVSCTGCWLSLTTLGVYFYMKNNQFSVEAIFWLPLFSFFLYVFTFCIGLGPLPWVVLTDLFPSDVKSLASSLTSFVCFLGSFLAMFFFPSLTKILGMALSFWTFGVICFGGAIFVYLVLPETKGKSLQEIQKMLEGCKL